MKRIDPITLEIVGNLLLSVAEEMGVTLVKTAYSTNIKERKDCSTALFDAKGRMIAQAEYVPMHLGSMLGVVGEVLKKFPVQSLRPGDMFVTNDPYAGGGTHLPDITMVSPVFLGDRLVAFVANIAHHSDIGGMVPGSVSAHSDNIYQEGLRIPLGRICRAGELVQETYDYIILNTRTPVERSGDLDAQIASNIAGTKRMAEVVRKYGPDYFAECTDALLDYAEQLMRAGIRTLPEGTYTFEDYLDDAGANSDTPIPIRAAITIEDGTAKVDFTGTSPQVPGPLNMTYSGLLTTAFYCFKAVAGQSIFANHGIYRALQVTAPEGTIVNCKLPVPVGQRIDTAQRVVDVILGALAQVAPDRVLAACNSVVTSAIFSGTNPKTGNYFVYLETIAGGAGAHSRGDGLSGVQVHMTNTSNLPVEALEREYPVLVERYQLRTDSGGAGRFRGGLGIQRDFRILSDGMSYTGLGDRHKFAPWGLEGGKSGSPGSFWVSLNGGEPERLGSKISGISLNKEDLVRVCSPGSGGYGNPYDRPAESVLKDVREGKVSRQAAEADYGVVLVSDSTGLRIDEQATAERRAGAKA
ncbi:hydantoinase B/oxoprolinase family protein [Paenibacillus ehimensis]|uniref:Hydantoinase B/oxoprolinase family protein n=1 Tax=Paenibacillus ehimensis TaxID=79264 RepID=A0ABT8VGW2_9BACL|nr:hydantoinase B/oxoprolinase family protein [Paenibacillus ehimensis]MDO3680215.1 hydantoinase B/oxoprolinase family protein [Paenibacillus ehimensis]MEC0208337.1 hydantoinase B/oxoprolinase family protein [Paenibacillus ehimensis]